MKKAMKIQAQFPPPEKSNKKKNKNNKMNKNHPIKFYLFFAIKAIKNEYRHTYYFIKIPAIFLISMNIRKEKTKCSLIIAKHL